MRQPYSAKHLQGKIAARKSKSTCHECGQRGHWAGVPQCRGTRDANFTTLPYDQVFPDREDSQTIMMVERFEPFGVFPPCSSSRGHSVCMNSVLNVRHFLVDSHIPVSRFVIGTVPSALSVDSQKICRSVMESSESSESKPDLGQGIIDTACLFCVAGSELWSIKIICWRTLV